MSEIESGKEQFVLTAPERTIVKRSKPTLMSLGNRIVPSDGRFHPDLAAQYIRDHGGRTRWIPTGELARVFFSGNNPHNKRRVRQRFFRIWNETLKAGALLVVEFDPRTRGAVACKLYDPRSREEQQYVHARLARMNSQRFLKADQLQQATALAQCLEAAVSERPSDGVVPSREV
jgi:hypothetical protein